MVTLPPKMSSKTRQLIFFITLLMYRIVPSYFLPLSTNKRWIVDSKSGERVKLHCVNWASHLETMVAEGLHAKPLQDLAVQLATQQFNCVRLTWAIFMFTRASYAKRTVEQSFDSLNLKEAKAGIAQHNGFLLNMTLVQAFEAVVGELGRHGVVVVLDNHVSKPTWCCSETDGNGFFGDTYFSHQEWLQGLTMVARRFRGKSQVVGIGMRNELRGPLENQDDWYHYIRQGARKVHQENPDLLVFISGLSYANNLAFLREKPLGVELDDKLVYEAHLYPWSRQPKNESWEVEDLNMACDNKTQLFVNQTAFVNSGDNPVPLWVAEIGIDQRGLSGADDHFLSCFLAYAADEDIDWGLWAWQGSYYFREGKTDPDETFGVLDYDWNDIRNPQLQKRLELIKRKNYDPISTLKTSYVLFQPKSGSCVRANGAGEIYATDCKNFSQWTYERDGAPIVLMGTDRCLKAVGDGLAPILSTGTDCSSEQSSWNMLSQSKLHLAAKDESGKYLCLHHESPYTENILTKKCNFIAEDAETPNDLTRDPTIQWFKLVRTNV